MSTVARIRKWLFGVLVLEVLGTFVELVLLEHYENVLQYVPLVLLALTLVLVVWHVMRPRTGNVRILQATMVAFVFAGIMGVGLHLQGAAEFQRETDPTQSPLQVLAKALRAQAPPALAPGVMVQMGLLGLVYAYRHPAAASEGAAPSDME